MQDRNELDFRTSFSIAVITGGGGSIFFSTVRMSMGFSQEKTIDLNYYISNNNDV